LRKLASVLSVLLILAYPLAIWLIERQGGNASARLLLTSILVAVLFLRFLGPGRLRTWLPVTAVLIGALCLLSALSASRERLFLMMPVAVNASVLGFFAFSLTPGRTPAIERFARMVHPDLSPGRIAHCRQVTKAWCVFLVINGLVSLYLAYFATVSMWTLYTGGISYLLMGTMFVAEYAIRRIRFG
jgi:uncharacterized membrane protein